MSDAPEGPEGLAGGMKEGDPGLEGATETGGTGPGHPETSDPDDSSSTELQGQEGGTASGGGT